MKLRHLMFGCVLGLQSLFAMDCGHFGVGGEFLYWEPCAPAFGWAVSPEAGLQIGTKDVAILRPGYHTGFRVGVSYLSCDCCLSADLYYRWYEQDSTATVGPATIFFGDALGAIFERGRAFQHFNYQDVDLRLGMNLYACDCWSLRGFGNVRYLHIEQFQVVKGFDTTDFGARSSRVRKEFDGGAVGVGALAEYCLCGGFGLIGEAGVMVGLGNQSNSIAIERFGSTGTLDARTSDKIPSTSACIGGFDVKLGAKYCTSCYCFDIEAELAYELHYYLNPLRIAVLNNTTGTISLGFHGLVFGLKGMF